MNWYFVTVFVLGWLFVAVVGGLLWGLWRQRTEARVDFVGGPESGQKHLTGAGVRRIASGAPLERSGGFYRPSRTNPSVWLWEEIG